MMPSALISVLALALCVLIGPSSAAGRSHLVVQDNFEVAEYPNTDFMLDYRLKKLLKSVRKAQAKKSTNYTPRKSYPPLVSWSRQEGIYDSFVHLNFHGNYPAMSLLRNGYLCIAIPMMSSD